MFDDVPQEVFTRWDITEHQVNRHLLSNSPTGTPAIVADLLTFPPGFIHHMHRHPHADMIVVPLAGSVQFTGDFTQTVDMTSGQMLVAYTTDPWGTVLEVMSHSYAEAFSNWPQPGQLTPPTIVPRPDRGARRRPR